MTKRNQGDAPTMGPADIYPIASDYGHSDLTTARAHKIQENDADCYKTCFFTGCNPNGRQWTRDETNAAIMDRRVLMFALSDALKTIEQLSPRIVNTWVEADTLPEGTTVVEGNGEIATIHHEGGEHYWYSPGDENHYRSTRLSYPLKVIPLPTGAWIEADEAEEKAAQDAKDEEG